MIDVDVKKLTDEQLIYLSYIIEKEIMNRIQCNEGKIEEEKQENKDI